MANAFARDVHQVAMVKPLDRSLETQSDKQADRDRNEMYEKVPPSMYRLVRRVDIHNNSPVTWVIE
jgi:hypothetical protein